LTEYKVEKSRLKKEEIESWKHKKNIFLLNKRQYVKEYLQNHSKLKAQALKTQRLSNGKFILYQDDTNYFVLLWHNLTFTIVTKTLYKYHKYVLVIVYTSKISMANLPNDPLTNEEYEVAIFTQKVNKKPRRSCNSNMPNA
jgi:hypothetical protein